MKVKSHTMENNFKIVILAAGLGKRMGNPDGLPKVLTPLKGKPMISYLLDSINKSGLDSSPVIVVGNGADQVKQTLGPNYTYVLQKQQLGTGHAVTVAKPALSSASDVMVLYGDHMLVSAELIKLLAATHSIGNSVLTMATFVAPNFDGWRAEFKSFSRLIRNSEGNIVEDIQVKDAKAEQLAIMELNPCYFCFKADWLWENLAKVGNTNAQHEYYLTDLIKMAIDQGHVITTVNISNIQEALGVNTKEQLTEVEKLL